MADESKRLAREILSYLVKNPNAQDSLSGVIKWWLLEPLTVNHTSVVKKALDDLVLSELILQRQGKDAQTYYRINLRRLKDISAFLKDKD